MLGKIFCLPEHVTCSQTVISTQVQPYSEQSNIKKMTLHSRICIHNQIKSMKETDNVTADLSD